MGGVDEALEDDVIDDGAGGWWSANGDECAMAAVAFVFEDIVDEDEEDDCKRCSGAQFVSDAGPVCRSIMQ